MSVQSLIEAFGIFNLSLLNLESLMEVSFIIEAELRKIWLLRWYQFWESKNKTQSTHPLLVMVKLQARVFNLLHQVFLLLLPLGQLGDDLPDSRDGELGGHVVDCGVAGGHCGWSSSPQGWS